MRCMCGTKFIRAVTLIDGGAIALDPPSTGVSVTDLGYGHGDTAIQRTRVVGP